MNLGNYEIIMQRSGFYSMRDKSSGEIMHSVSEPMTESRELYVKQLKPEKELLLPTDEELVVWDVGLGAAAMLAIAAGRFVSDGDILFAGTGVALLAAGCAKRIHAPRAVVFVETGGIDPSLDEIPLAVADPRVMDGTCINAGIIEAFSYIASPRLHTIAFLGAAQIDRFGNLNSTCIGDYEHPKVRFSGSGGACDAASLASTFIVFMEHGRRKFVEKLDYLTSPGWLEGGDSRARAGFARGGPLAVTVPPRTSSGVLSQRMVFNKSKCPIPSRG